VPRTPTQSQVSAGGVVYRKERDGTQVALILVGASPRWQLPKGLVNAGESEAEAALREVSEETGLTGTIQAPIDTIEYWYYGDQGGRKVRFHKVVHFYLIAFGAGSTDDHDHEVHEARWFPIDEARELLAFKNEKNVMDKAKDLLGGEG
jgi:8-oxo-dGTP pyrophosphatase MutT (NUDIX family)